MLCNAEANVCIFFFCWLFLIVELHKIKLFSAELIVIQKKLSQVINLQELNRVLEAGLEPAQPLLAKGF